MSDSAHDTGGAMDSLRRLASSVTGLIQARTELFGIELQEEKLRAISLLVWLCVAIAFGIAGVLVGVVALGLFLWQRLGYLGLIGLASGSVLVATGILWIMRRRILSGPQPFESTVKEFRKDLECLRQRD
jgi:uncharacterized membrane protein YqjE